MPLLYISSWESACVRLRLVEKVLLGKIVTGEGALLWKLKKAMKDIIQLRL